MYTQSHVIMGAALFGRNLPARAWAGAVGGLLPDIPILLVVLGIKLSGIPAPVVFGLLYWQDWWQITTAVTHNFWLWGGLVVLGLVMRDRLTASAASFDRWTLLAVFSGSALLHAVIDFLSHREDAHMSLWPVTSWKFVSPVSYWDPAHFGTYASLFEAALGVALAVLLFRRYQNWGLRAALVLAITLYLPSLAFL